jgi:hypothetical protein
MRRVDLYPPFAFVLRDESKSQGPIKLFCFSEEQSIFVQKGFCFYAQYRWVPGYPFLAMGNAWKRSCTLEFIGRIRRGFILFRILESDIQVQ